jgi:RsiW-degrading membrane proteinase PrsW (M82 family)
MANALNIEMTCSFCKEQVIVPNMKNQTSETPPLNSINGGVQKIGHILATAGKEFKALDYRFLLPIKKFFTVSWEQKRTVQWLLILGLAPLFLAQLHQTFQFSFIQVIWLIQIYFCSLWAIYVYSLVNPSLGIWKRSLLYALFTTLIGLPLLLAFGSLPLIRDLYLGIDQGSLLSRGVRFVLLVGITEELCKALPLIYGLRKGQIKGIREGIFLGFISGLAFAAAEGVQYTILATVYAHVDGALPEQFLTLLFRLLSAPLLHGAWAGTVGWFIAIAATKSGAKWPLVVVGIVLMGTLHGLYDTFAGHLIGLALAALTFVTFLAYLSHEQESNEKAINPPTA